MPGGQLSNRLPPASCLGQGKEAVVTTVKQETQEVRHTLHILDKSGDTRLEWSPANPQEVAEVREKFDEIVKGLKYLAYTTPADGSQGEAIREFNPDVSIVLTPQMQGG
jgi:hypothetical protein